VKEKSEDTMGNLVELGIEFAVIAVLSAALVDLHLSPFGFWRTGAVVWSCVWVLCRVRGKRVP